MWKPLARSFDSILSMTLARFVRLRGELPRPDVVPDDPDDVKWPELVELEFTPLEPPPVKGNQGKGEPQWDFSFPSPVRSVRGGSRSRSDGSETSRRSTARNP